MYADEPTPIINVHKVKDSGDDQIHTNPDELETIAKRLLVLPAPILTTIVSLILIRSDKAEWTLRHGIYDWVVSNRATTQIIVQLLAAFLGIAQVSTFKVLSNFSARRTFARSPMTLDLLSFHGALATSQISWSLPTPDLITLLAIATISLIPAALWTGALTPTLSTARNRVPLYIHVPTYSNGSKYLWQNRWNGMPAPRTQNELGIFSYSPQKDRYGFFINDGTSASRLDGEPQMYKKSDNSNYTYHGRSYGIGSSIGLNDNFVTANRHLVSYSYSETGYLAKYNCLYNREEGYRLQGYQNSMGQYTVTHYPWAPNGNNAASSAYSVYDSSGQQKVAAAATYNTSHLFITALRPYLPLNETQCINTFAPTIFSVNVDVTQRLITVRPTNSENVKDIDPTGIIAGLGHDSLGSISKLSSTSYTSIVGDMLLNNIFNAKQQGTNETDEQKTLRGIQETINVLFDQAVVSVASAQLVMANDSTPALVVAQVQVFRIGQPVYIYAMAALSSAILLLVLIDAARTHFWRGLPKFNLVDTKSVAVASSHGGSAVANVVHRKHERAGTNWIGAADDRHAGAVEVVLARDDNGLAVRLR